MEVASIFLSPLLQALFDKLASRVLLDFSARQRIRSRLDKLKDNLDMISQVIARADNMLVREKGVDGWLEEVRDWAYDADDFLDEVNTRAMQEEEEEARRNNISRSSISAFVTKVRDLGFRFNPGKYSEDVDELNSRLDAISKRMRKIHSLTKMAATYNTSTPPLPMLQRPLEATAYAFDARVFGREQDKEKIIEQLKSSRDADVEVIPIVGMPGIGKTTLARHVFHSVQQQHQQPPIFDINGWVCVSDDYDVNRITRDILESFTSRASDLRGLNQLQSELKEVAGGKRFLLVLDDVWTRNYSDWDDLLSPFGVGAPGSKILVTTRDDRVASMVQADLPKKIHHLGTLCDDDCWSVFLQHVISKRRPVFESEAGRFRVKILEKCKGLPLAAKLLAGLLRGESTGRAWEAKLNSSIWDHVSENDVGLSGRKGNRMLPVVMLSYFHLPPQLKRCFSYCSVIPEDYEFGEEEVVMRWIAQGLVLAEGGEEVEVTGAKYFSELVSRSLFQPSPNNPSRFLMHDLINEMAEIIAGKSCVKLDEVANIDSSTVKARYSSYPNFRGLKTEFEAFEKTIYLREFQSFRHTLKYSEHLTSYVPLELLMKLKYLRVLRLNGYSVRELPGDIGDLIHLRLVDLSYTYIIEMPESTCRLYNLLALRLQGCRRLRTLPAKMRRLVNLRNLDCSGVNELEAMPVEMGKLTSLQKLSNFIVGKGLGQGVGQLKGLSHLKGSISISFLENVHDSEEAKEAKLMRKEGLQSLELKWNSGDGDLQGTVLTELQPHEHLEELSINGYSGLRFPGWVGDDSFSKMRVIKLANCGKCTSLPPLGKLPVLEEIEIRNMAGIECVGEEFYGKEGGAFPSLKILKFEVMENWSTWLYPAAGGCRFACLQELHVIRCPKLLLSLPVGINVQKLNVIKCDALLIALPRHSILELTIRECKVELMECLEDDGDASELLPSVSSLNIEKVDAVEVVGSARARMNIINNKDVVEVHHQMMMFRSLTALEITSIPKLTYLPAVVLQGLPKLEKLNIRRCEELKSLWKRVDGEMEIGGLIFLEKQESQFLKSLRGLEVVHCCQLVCLVPEGGEEDDDTNRDTDISGEEEEKEEKRGKQQCLGLPCGLERLQVTKCEKLEKLPSDMHNLTSLGWVDVGHCERLSCLPEMGFPSNLESLRVEDCESLTCLSSSSSSSFGVGGNGMRLPHSLKGLYIRGCKNLESLVSAAFTSADSFPSLEFLYISECPILKSLPECVHRRLKHLTITGCQNLGELPPISVHHLPALEYLAFDGWAAGLLSIQQGGPHPNSLLPNLRRLDIEGVGGTMTPSVPLPSSLTSLSISKFNNLSPEAFENLISLGELHIRDCPALTSIPEQLLPPSLLSLGISGCPLLAPHFAKGKGRYWHKVKFIPEVEIDRRSIFDLKQDHRCCFVSISHCL